MNDYRLEAIKISDELVRSIECTIIQIHLLREIATPETYGLVADDIEASIEKQEAWQATAKERKLKYEREEK